MQRTVFSVGFTLVELLIVAVVLSVFAAVVVTNMSDTSLQAKEGALASLLHRTRSAIDRYHVEHGGVYPGQRASVFGASCPNQPFTPGSAGTAEALLHQLRYYTNSDGQICASKSPDFPFGPYLRWNSDTSNPVTGRGDVVVIGAGGLQLSADGAAMGFKYDRVSGRFIANDNRRDSKGVPYEDY